MWWLIVPVTIYSLGIFALWLILVIRRDEIQLSTNIQTRVTVVVAVRNEEKTIANLLKELAEQVYPDDLLEIIIVNDNSTDRTPVIVSEFISRHRQHSSLNIRLIYNIHSGKKSALRYGASKAMGDLILTTDADCRPGHQWVSAHALFYASTGADMVLAPVFQVTGRGFTSLFGAFEFSALQGVTEATARAGFPVMCNGANMGIRREIYLSHSGDLHDDLPSGDDVFLLHAVKRAGGRIRYLPGVEAAVETASAVSAAALLSQRARWASKAGRYRDPAIITLAAATAACNVAVAAAAVTALFSPEYLPVVASLYLLRLTPDYLIARHSIKKREEHMLLPLFLIMDLIYPFYFVTVGLLSLVPTMRHFRKSDG